MKSIVAERGCSFDNGPKLAVGLQNSTAQKMKFSVKDFFSKYDQIRSFLRIWSQLLKKSLMENFIFCAVIANKKKIFLFWLSQWLNHKFCKSSNIFFYDS